MALEDLQDNNTELNEWASIMLESEEELRGEEENLPEEEDVTEEELEEEEDPITEESEEEDAEVAEDTEEPDTASDDLNVDDEVFPENLNDLATAFEVEEDRIKEIVVASKKDGTPVTLDQVLHNWNVSESVNRKSQEISELKKELDKEKTYYASEMTKKLEDQELIVRALEEAYINAGSEELEELRVVDPAEYAARKMELADKAKNLDVIRNKIHEEQQQLQQQQNQEYQQRRQAALMHEQEALFLKAPEYKDAAKFEKESKSVVDFLVGEGYSKEELASVVDHRVLLIARDAMRYRNMEATAEPKKKRVVRKPKSVRAGNATKRRTTKEKSLTKKMADAAASNDTRVKQDAIAELLRSI